MKTLISKRFFIFIYVFMLLLVSCNTDPSASQGEIGLKEAIAKNSKVNLEISKFTKTNGIKREIMGQPIYTMEFSTQIKIGQKCGFVNLGQMPIEKFYPIDQLQQFSSVYYANTTQIIMYEGALVNYDGEMEFEKTDNGWRMTKYSLNNFQIVSNNIPLSEFNSVGVINSLDFQGNKFLYIDLLSTKSEKITVVCSAGNNTLVFKDNQQITWSDLQKGMKIGIIGNPESGDLIDEGKIGLSAHKIYILN